MLRLISIASLTAIFLSLAVVSADAETWTRHWTGPYGTSRSATVQCGYRGCGYQMQAIGPTAPHGRAQAPSCTGPTGATVTAPRPGPREHGCHPAFVAALLTRLG